MSSPVFIVHKLPYERVRLHGKVLVDLGHIDVVHEVDHKLAARRAEVATRLLLQRLLEHALDHLYTSETNSFNLNRTVIGPYDFL